MRQRLWALRLAVAIVAGALFAIAFLGPAAPAQSLATWLPRTQVGPALYRLLGASSLAAGLLLVSVAVLTLLAGRVYCAACCPLGILQDAIRFLARQVPALRRWQDRPSKGRQPPSSQRLVLRWAVLGVTVALAVLGCSTAVVVLEPYSACGRVLTQVGGPTVRAGREVLSAALERFDIYGLAGGLAPITPAAVLGLGMVFLLAVAILAALDGRLYCTTLCPVGTCLGLLAQAAPLRVRFDTPACAGCGLCARRCRAHCIQGTGAAVRVDRAACVACMDCLAVCPTGAVRYGLPARRGGAGPRPAAAGSDGRRELLAAGVVLGVAAVSRPWRGLSATPPADDASGGPVSPPGSGARARFVQNCTACQLCVTVCPTRVLKPALFEYGVGGLLQPRLSFLDGFCEYDCNRCTRVCPTGALLPLSLPEKQRTQLGVAQLYKDRCIVYCRGEECGACAEVCPTHAVHTQDRDGLLYPEMAAGACTGCGACECACPVQPRAIAVIASAVHGHAAPPYVPAAAALPADGTTPSGDAAPPAAASPPSSAAFPF